MGRAQGITHATGAKGTSVLALAPTRRPERAPAPALSCEYPIPTSHLRYATGSLLVLAGPSGVGKSTFGNRLLPKGSILSSDHMRQLISGDAGDMAASGQAFQLLHEVTSRRLAAGRTVIVDSTALSYRPKPRSAGAPAAT